MPICANSDTISHSTPNRLIILAATITVMLGPYEELLFPVQFSAICPIFAIWKRSSYQYIYRPATTGYIANTMWLLTVIIWRISLIQDGDFRHNKFHEKKGSTCLVYGQHLSDTDSTLDLLQIQDSIYPAQHERLLCLLAQSMWDLVNEGGHLIAKSQKMLGMLKTERWCCCMCQASCRRQREILAVSQAWMTQSVRAEYTDKEVWADSVKMSGKS